MLAALGLCSPRSAPPPPPKHPVNPRIARTLENGCGRAHSAEVAALQCIPPKLLSEHIYSELVQWDVPMPRSAITIAIEISEFILLAICTTGLVILRMTDKPVRGVRKESRSETFTKIPWVAIEGFSVSAGDIVEEPGMTESIIAMWSGEKQKMVPCHRIRIRFRQMQVPDGRILRRVQYTYNGFTEIKLVSIRGNKSSKVGNFVGKLKRAWQEGILKVVKGVDLLEYAPKTDGISDNAHIRQAISAGEEILRDNVYTGKHVANGVHYDSDKGIDYVHGHSFANDSHILENISKVAFSNSVVKSALLRSNRLVVHVVKVLLSCARAGDRIARARQKDAKIAELEEKHSLLGQPGGRRLVWSCLCFCHSLMYGMDSDQAIMFLPHTDDLLEAFSSDFSPRFRLAETTVSTGNFLDKSIRRLQLAVLVQLICDMAPAELEAEKLESVAELTSDVELQRFQEVARMRFIVGWKPSFFMPTVIFENLPILLEEVESTRLLQAAVENRDFFTLRGAFKPVYAATLNNIDPRLVAKGREILNELNSEHLEAAIEEHLNQLTAPSTELVAEQNFAPPPTARRRRGASAQSSNNQAEATMKSTATGRVRVCKHSALATAIRTAEGAGRLDHAVAERARSLSFAAWERDFDDGMEEGCELRLVFVSEIGYHQVMMFSLPEPSSGNSTYGFGWRKRGVDDRFTLVANWMSAGQSFEHGEDEFEATGWGTGGAGANLKGSHSFEDSDLVLRLRLHGRGARRGQQTVSQPWDDEVLLRWDPSAATLRGSSQSGDPASFVRLGTHSCDRRTASRIEAVQDWEEEERTKATERLKASLLEMGRQKTTTAERVAAAERDALVKEDVLDGFKTKLMNDEQRVEVAAEHVRHWMVKARMLRAPDDLSDVDVVFFGLRNAIRGADKKSALKALSGNQLRAMSARRTRAGSDGGGKAAALVSTGTNPLLEKNQAKRANELAEAKSKLKELAMEKLKLAISSRNYAKLKRSLAVTAALVEKRAVIKDAEARLATLEQANPSSPVKTRRRAGMLRVTADGSSGQDDDRHSKADALNMTRFPAMTPSAALYNSLRLFELILRTQPAAEVLQICPVESWHTHLSNPAQYKAILSAGATIDSASREKLYAILAKLQNSNDRPEKRTERKLIPGWVPPPQAVRAAPSRPPQLARRQQSNKALNSKQIQQQPQLQPQAPSGSGQFRRSFQRPRQHLRGSEDTSVI